MHIDSHKGKIEQVKIFSDSLHPEMIEEVTKHLIGKEYSSHGVHTALNEVAVELPMIADYLDDFKGWLSDSIS